MITTMDWKTEFDFLTDDISTAAPTISEEKTELARLTMNRISGPVSKRNSWEDL